MYPHEGNILSFSNCLGENYLDLMELCKYLMIMHLGQSFKFSNRKIVAVRSLSMICFIFNSLKLREYQDVIGILLTTFHQISGYSTLESIEPILFYYQSYNLNGCLTHIANQYVFCLTICDVLSRYALHKDLTIWHTVFRL